MINATVIRTITVSWLLCMNRWHTTDAAPFLSGFKDQAI